MKKLTALLSAMLLVLNTAVFTVNATDDVLDFDNDTDKSYFELWDDENESSLEFPTTGGVDGGACLKFVSQRTSSKYWIPATVTYTFENPKNSGTQVVELYIKIPASEQGDTAARHVINVSNSKGVRANGSELNMQMSGGKLTQVVDKSSGREYPEIGTYDDNWHKYTFVMDIDNRKIKFYQDDEYKTETDFRRLNGTQPSDGYLNTFDITTDDGDYKRTIYIDKFKISDSYTPPEIGGGENPDIGGDEPEIPGGDATEIPTSVDFEDDSWKNAFAITNISSSSDGVFEVKSDSSVSDSKYLRMYSAKTSGAAPTMTYTIPKSLQKTTGNIVFEFDAFWPAVKEEIPTATDVPQIMLNAYNENNLSELSMAMRRQRFLQHITRNGGTTTTDFNGIAYENQWHKYTFVMNLDDRKITYYEDDVKLGESEFRRDSAQAGKAITSVAFVNTVKVEKRALYIDNFSVSDSYTPPEPPEDGGDEGEEDSIEILNEGFDSGKLPAGFNLVGGNATVEEREEFGGNALKLAKNNDSSKETELKFTFSEQAKVALEFDVMLVTSGTSLKASLDLISSDKIAATSWGMSLSLTNGNINNKTLDGGTTTEAALPDVVFEANKKYNLKFIADSKSGAERGNFDYYIDGKKIGEANLRLDSVPCLKTLVLKMPAGAGAGDFLYIDNLKITKIKIPEIEGFDVLSSNGESLGEITANVPGDVLGFDFRLALMEDAYIKEDFSGVEFYAGEEKKNIDVSYDNENKLLKVRFKENTGYEKNCKIILAGITDSLKSVLPTQTITFKTEEPPVKFVVKFYDKNDNAITSLPAKGEKVKVKVSAKNNTESLFEGAVICSVYSDGELIDITQEFPKPSAGTIGNAAFEVTVPEKGNIGIYFWNNCKEMVRISDAIFLGQ